MKTLWPEARSGPRMLVGNPCFMVVVTFTLLLGAIDVSRPSAAAGERSRSFRMGFTAFPHDFTPEAVEETRKFVRTNADLIAHHIEGVPWTEALRAEPFSEELLGFIHRDYDALWDKIKATAPELFMAWRDCGLLDERGTARPAYTVWREYFERPLRRGE